MPEENYEQLVVELSEHVRGRYYGKYRGTVEDVSDPEDMGRIKCRVPSVYGDEVSPHALPCVPFAGDQHGFYMLPEVGDGVWVEFEAGDPSRPIWTGFWFARDEIPPPGSEKQRVIVTPEQLKLVLDDQSKKIELIHPDGAKITLSSTKITLEISPAKVELSASGVAINGVAFEVAP